jgi:hypothetical protein
VIDGSDFRRLTEDIPALHDGIRATAAERATAPSVIGAALTVKAAWLFEAAV